MIIITVVSIIVIIIMIIIIIIVIVAIIALLSVLYVSDKHFTAAIATCMLLLIPSAYIIPKLATFNTTADKEHDSMHWQETCIQKLNHVWRPCELILHENAQTCAGHVNKSSSQT